MDRDSCFQLGYIVRPHGLKGEVKAVFETEHPEAYMELGSVFVDTGGELIPFFLENLRRSGNYFILGFEDIRSVDEASTLNGSQLWLPESMLPELADDEFYFHDIIGFSASDKTLGELGIISDYYTAGAQDILSVRNGQREILIPMHRSMIDSVDKKSEVIIFDLPEGLVDIYSE